MLINLSDPSFWLICHYRDVSQGIISSFSIPVFDKPITYLISDSDTDAISVSKKRTDFGIFRAGASTEDVRTCLDIISPSQNVFTVLSAYNSLSSNADGNDIIIGGGTIAYPGTVYAKVIAGYGTNNQFLCPPDLVISTKQSPTGDSLGDIPVPNMTSTEIQSSTYSYYSGITNDSTTGYIVSSTPFYIIIATLVDNTNAVYTIPVYGDTTGGVITGIKIARSTDDIKTNTNLWLWTKLYGFTDPATERRPAWWILSGTQYHPDGGISGGSSDDDEPYKPYQKRKDDPEEETKTGGNPDPDPFGDDGKPDDITWNPENVLDASDLSNLHIYELTSAQLSSLMGKLWDDSLLDSLGKAYESNIGNVILRIYRSNFVGSVKGSREVKLGGYATGITANYIKQYAREVPWHTFTLPEYYWSWEDYQTELYIWLPFVGFKPLDPSKYLSKNGSMQINVSYYIDFLHGIISYLLDTGSLAHDNTKSNRATADIFEGSIAGDIPITQTQYTSALSGILQLIGGAAVFAGGLAAAPATGGASAVAGTIASGVDVAALGAGATAAISGAMNMNRKTTQSSGLGSGNFGFLEPIRPYILAYRPTVTYGANEIHYGGYGARQTFSIGALSDGTYQQIYNTNLTGNIPDEYKGEIIQTLQNGVII